MLGVAAAVAVLGGSTAVAVHHDQASSAAVTPDRRLTPGAWDNALTVAYLCNNPTSERRNVSAATKRKVFAEYGVAYPSTTQRGQWEVDHLVPLALGGTNDLKNLWPEKAPGFHAKDKLELKLFGQVCDDKLALRTAQVDIATNWRAAAKKYNISDVPDQPVIGATP